MVNIVGIPSWVLSHIKDLDMPNVKLRLVVVFQCFSNELKTWISWLDDSSLQIGKTYLLQHRFKTVRVKIQAINQKWNINDWEFVAADEIKLNDIAQVSIKTNQPLFYDAFAENPKSGNAILIDETSLNTVGALMFL